jgi:hypothetical protein
VFIRAARACHLDVIDALCSARFLVVAWLPNAGVLRGHHVASGLRGDPSVFPFSRAVRARIALVVCSIVITLFLAEAVIRIWSPIPDEQLLPFPYNASRVYRIADGDVSIGFDPDLGWRPTPSRVRRDNRVLYRHNDQGMRADHEYALDRPADTQRIEAFGDSFTYCAEVTQDACWVSRLDRAWPQTEVMNFGVSGYGPDQAWLRYQRDGRPYQPCAVLIGYYVEDIDRVVNRFRAFIDPNESVMLSKPRFLLDGDGLALLPNPTTDPLELGDPAYVEKTLGEHDSWYFPGIYVKGPFDNLDLVRLVRTAAFRESRTSLLRDADHYPLYDQRGEAFQVTGRVLIQFAEEVRADGATPIVVVFPGRRDLMDSASGPPVYLPLVSWLKQAGVPTLDLTDVMRGEVAKHGLDDLFEVTHYSDLGNRIVAEHLADQVPAAVSSTCHPL